MKKPELLLPAGNLGDLKLAFLYGADAVYIGGDAFSLRAKADNFSRADMEEAVSFAHERGGRVYVTVNIFAHNGDLGPVRTYLHELNEIKPDGVLISDPGIFSMASEILDDIELHISTQANTTNYATAEFWHRQGAARVVAARELSLAELSEMKRNMPEGMELETFVHGAMCISYSGRCLMSNYFTGRDANRGACTHPCRWSYALMEEKRPGEYLPVYENERGTYVFNSRDLCMIEHIPELCEAGIDSLKIEGRMKNALYIATCARVYRAAIDDLFEDPKRYGERIPWYKSEVESSVNRGFTTGFYFGRPDAGAQVYESSTYKRPTVFLGVVEEDDEGRCFIRQKNKFSVGETIEMIRPNEDNKKGRILSMRDEYGNEIESAPHPKQKIYFDCGLDLKPYDIIRKRAEKEG